MTSTAMISPIPAQPETTFGGKTNVRPPQRCVQNTIPDRITRLTLVAQGRIQPPGPDLRPAISRSPAGTEGLLQAKYLLTAIKFPAFGLAAPIALFASGMPPRGASLESHPERCPV